MSRRSTVTRFAAMAVAATLAACGVGEEGPMGPAEADIMPNLAVGDRDNDFGDFTPGLARVCAFYTFPTPSFEPSTFSASATGGDVAGSFTIAGLGTTQDPHCFEAWNATDASLVDFTASLVAPAEGLQLDRIVTMTSTLGTDPVATTITDETSATISVSDLVNGMVWFKFVAADEPPLGGQGCTPGYWRQEHHFDSWTDYAPTDLFSSVFDDAFPGETLLDVVWARGGGVNALGRHAVAALLNAASAGVDYDYAVGEVIAAFNDAYATGDRHLMEDQKNVFDFLNNQGCNLN